MLAMHCVTGAIETPDVPDGTVCQWGCWDEEDEACHAGLSQNGCAEIYGHVTWAQVCDCGLSDTVAEPKDAEQNIYFSVPVFIVLFRESLEVVIFLSIILQFLNKSKEDGMMEEAQHKRFSNEVYLGAFLGFFICMILGAGMVVAVYMTASAFEGDARLIFEFIMMMLTTGLLSFMALQFFKMILSKEAHERKFRQMFSDSIRATQDAERNGDATFKQKYAFFVFAFTTGMREGMESIGFLIAIVPDIKDLSSLPLPIILALVLSRLVGCCFFQGTKGMKVDKFMKASSVFLLFICAGFFSCSMHALQELEVFGTWSPKSERPWANQKVWDARECCSDKTNKFFVLMRALLGWQDQPTPVELLAYFLYWLVAICLGYVLVNKIKKDMDARVAEWRRQDEMDTQVVPQDGEVAQKDTAANESEESQPKNAERNDEPFQEDDENAVKVVVVR